VALTKPAKPHHKAPHWSGKLGAHEADCEALIHGKLPKSFLDDKVSFRLSFDGNGKVAGFTKTRTLKLSPPPPSPVGGSGGGPVAPGTGGGGIVTNPAPPTTTTDTTPTQTQTQPPATVFTQADGSWSGYADNRSDPDYLQSNVDMAIVNGTLNPFSTNQNILLHSCHSVDFPDDEVINYHYVYQHSIGLRNDGSFAGDYTRNEHNNSSGTGQEIHLVVTGTYNQADDTIDVHLHAEGTLWELDATAQPTAHRWDGCTGTFVGTLHRNHH
jgi:hypothetical protein